MTARCKYCGAASGHIPGCADNQPLPDGVFERAGQLFYTCRSCESDVPLEVDVTEFDADVAYCGGSPRCLP